MMSSSRAGDRSLSLRLNTLKRYHQREENIWDIGCDHGLLGLSFSEDVSVKSINLVDPSLPVIETLHNTIKDSYITKANIYIHHQEGQKILISPSSNCIFIAGMGGKEIGSILENLIPQIDESSRIIISPHRKIIELRKQLHDMQIALESEEVIFEDGQFYQIMCLRKFQAPKVSPYGEQLWRSETGKSYREHQMKYFGPHADQESRSYVEYLKNLF